MTHQTREQRLEQSVKELGVWLSKITHKGAFNPKIAAVLERARRSLKQE
jgi:hypothetical protein